MRSDPNLEYGPGEGEEGEMQDEDG